MKKSITKLIILLLIITTSLSFTACIKGDKGITPHIGKNGNWYIGITDTGVKASGEDGEKGEAGGKGLSAYGLYIERHPEYTDNEEQWINDLINGKLARFTVTFVVGGENIETVSDVKKGTLIKEPDTSDGEDCVLDGWYKDSGLSERWDFENDVVVADTILYAEWVFSTEGLEFELINNDTEYAVIGIGTAASLRIAIPAKHNGVSVTAIGRYAFNNCDNLTFVSIGSNVRTIEGNSFYSCDNLTELAVDTKNPYLSSVGGVLFNKDKTTLIYYLSGKTQSSYVVPDGVETIGDYAFYNCTGLTSITISDSVTNIGSYAFYKCSNLASATIPDSVTTIGEDAFYSCTGLSSVTIGSGMTTISKRLFVNCTKLASITIPDNITTIGDYAFYYCTGLTSITIPDSVTTLNVGVFSQCYSLGSISIPDSVTTIASFAFYYCTSLGSITIPDSVTTLGDSVFYFCTSLGSITIPDSVTSIGKNAFDRCTNLTSIAIGSGVTTISKEAFPLCLKLTSVTVNDDNLFYSSVDGILFNKDKTTLICYPSDKAGTSYTIPNSVTTIYDYAFYHCSNLTSITIPDSVTTINREAFSGCENLTSITIPNSVTTMEIYVFSIPEGTVTVHVKGFAEAPQGWHERWKGGTVKVEWDCQH